MRSGPLFVVQLAGALGDAVTGTLSKPSDVVENSFGGRARERSRTGFFV